MPGDWVADAMFQSTHPWGATFSGLFVFVPNPVFQSTHPRGCGYHLRSCKYPGHRVSIPHPWGATKKLFLLSIELLFQSTPTWGATIYLIPVLRDYGFNHAPVGATWICFQPGLPISFQSTHPRGVRRFYSPPPPLPSSGFNPRTRGVRPGPLICTKNFSFQSTHPREVRPGYAGSGGRGVAGFNPRTRGVRRTAVETYRLASFNPRTHVGCDKIDDVATAYTPGFNPRTHVGCDVDRDEIRVAIRFQSTHPWGATRLSGWPPMR